LGSNPSNAIKITLFLMAISHLANRRYEGEYMGIVVPELKGFPEGLTTRRLKKWLGPRLKKL
jgi:hypothetical protein